MGHSLALLNSMSGWKDQSQRVHKARDIERKSPKRCGVSQRKKKKKKTNLGWVESGKSDPAPGGLAALAELGAGLAGWMAELPERLAALGADSIF